MAAVQIRDVITKDGLRHYNERHLSEQHVCAVAVDSGKLQVTDEQGNVLIFDPTLASRITALEADVAALKSANDPSGGDSSGDGGASGGEPA